MGNRGSLDMRPGLDGILRSASDRELRDAVEKIKFRKVSSEEFKDTLKWTESYGSGQPGYVNHQNIGSVLIHKSRQTNLPDPVFSRTRWLVGKINSVETGIPTELFEIPSTLRIRGQNIQILLPLIVVITKFIYNEIMPSKSSIHVKFRTSSNTHNFGAKNSNSGGVLTLREFRNKIYSSDGTHGGWQMAWTAFKRDNTDIVLDYDLDTLYDSRVRPNGGRRDAYSKKSTFRTSSNNDLILDRDQRLLNDGSKYGRTAPVAFKIGTNYFESKAEILHRANEKYFGTTPSWYKQLCDLPLIHNKQSSSSFSTKNINYRSLQYQKAKEFIGIGTQMSCFNSIDAAKHLLSNKV